MKKKLLLMLSLCSLLFMVSCTKVDLCDETEHPHRAGVTFAFDWSNARNSKVTHKEPENMSIVAKRIIGTWKCEVSVDSQTGEGYYVFNAPPRKPKPPTVSEEEDEDEEGEGEENEGDDEDTDTDENVDEDTDTDTDADVETYADEGDDTDEGAGDGVGNEPDTDDENGEEGENEGDTGDEEPDEEEDPVPGYEPLAGVDFPTREFKMAPGTYKFVAFNRDETELIYDEIDRFVKSNKSATRFQDLTLEYKRYSYKDKNLKGMLADWRDYNNYDDSRNYIQPDITPIYYDTISPADINKNVLREYVFKPVLLTQNIDIRFRIRKEIDEIPFTIDSIYADISGIPYKVNLSNNQVDASTTCKMMFHVDLEDEKGTKIADSDDNPLLVCHGNIDVLSVVNAPDSIVGRGPGIMQVMVFIHDRQPVYAKINLYHPIGRANLYSITEDGFHIRRTRESGTIEIISNLLIDGNLTIGSDGDGLEQWKPTSDDDIIIDV